MTIRDEFVELFGEDQAAAIERAAEMHSNGVNSAQKGDDPFKWALLICIDYECMEKPRFRDHHGITASWDAIDQWLIERANLSTHNGDFDYLTALTGGYDRYAKTC